MHINITKVAVVTFAIFASTQIWAKDLGVIGKTYEIVEQDAVEQIQQKLKQMEATGELARLEKKAIDKSLHTLKNPKANPKIITVTKRSEKLHDPTQVIEHDIRAEDGTLIAPAGTMINPLRHMTLSKTMVFFDGRDKEQVQAVRALLVHRSGNFMPILTGGSWYEISKAWKRQVYFDQGGFMAEKMAIEQVPAVVTQQGQQLKISYIPAKELAQ
ncbi:type-F conjugative transfer system protein TraW [Moraxella catarrhalis]|jgi:conjugal transfer pilus assembly protein TraW|uniref:type-F conjugative transfer system protein TraW n=1 Tax=Moraxella catarrhalis TaxID=480 RepID=UPI000EA87727|nr:type-F conjugative transfer system protein TraW [Moraxella catarrhalis]MPW68369.1 type-F conjugative transfer system protein TraW [Moraxella catarrhalis]MPX16891.1 type-F conjugative transfer system protein TraW [Moraxella catarrhalis]MPX27866.1 type-F conjugative transfer system protein TraW [Moraxella catarrhalis]MPX57079.1 type-F conjugative transfer system protein TraW [Moraxella catarrhalis]MPX68937.1 type-F conjugative transfer system protein TraW [Moraxella catarrhalis]